MRTIQTLLAGVFCGVLSCVAAAQEAPVPPAFSASYEIHAGALSVGKMVRRFRVNETGDYSFESEVRPTGVIALFHDAKIEEISAGTISAAALRPTHYQYMRNGGNKDRKTTIVFDWDAKSITTSVQGDSWKMPTQPEVLDKLVYQIALMQDLATGKKELSYQVADGGKIKTYELALTGEELIITPKGRFNTIRVEYQSSGSSRKTTLWCAREAHFLPVQIAYREKDGQITTAVLSALEQ